VTRQKVAREGLILNRILSSEWGVSGLCPFGLGPPARKVVFCFVLTTRYVRWFHKLSIKMTLSQLTRLPCHAEGSPALEGRLGMVLLEYNSVENRRCFRWHANRWLILKLKNPFPREVSSLAGFYNQAVMRETFLGCIRSMCSTRVAAWDREKYPQPHTLREGP
jgi:hypothetical protein